MKKKYLKPQMITVELQQEEFIATSSYEQNVSLYLDQISEEEEY